MPPDKSVDEAIRRAVDPALLLIAGAYLIAALVGLPLFGDGGYYFFKLATDGEPLLPNLRYTALLPQLPGLAAMQFTADPVLLRHVFSISYQSLPWLSLAACWLLLRRRMPWLMLLPLLSVAGTLLNFSAVSELLSGLYLVWPLVLAMALAPERPWVRISVFLGGPLLLALHPMAFVLAFALAAAAGFIAWRAPDLRRVWRRLAIWIGVNGLIRLVWTLVGANAYERTNLTDTGMAHYLLPETAMQQLLLGAVLVCALLAVGAELLRRPPTLTARRHALVDWMLGFACALLLFASIGVSAEFLLGQGIKLKAGLTFVVAVLLMGLAFLVGSLSRADAATGAMQACRGGLPYRLVAAAILTLVLAKSAAWWTATRGLQDAIADSSGPCIGFSVDQPFGLQWPWMNIVDDWVGPVNALAFRPRIPRADGQGIEPMPLLLPGDGCRVLDATLVAHMTDWMHRPWAVLNDRFGPLRVPGRL
jgi:hypothetical protein